jgi:hypothetical protein
MIHWTHDAPSPNEGVSAMIQKSFLVQTPQLTPGREWRIGTPLLK